MTYKVLVGLNYPDGQGGEKRAEPGDLVDDLPKKSVDWLLEQGAIEKAAEAPAVKRGGEK